MAKKVLYLGQGKWCWTETCKVHAVIIAYKNEYLDAVANRDEEKIIQSTANLLSTPEGQHTYRYLKIAELEKTLGRKLTLGLDLDGTTGDFTHGLRTYMGEKLKITKGQWLKKFPSPQEYAMWKGEGAWYSDREDFLNQFQKAETEGLYTRVPVFKHASRTLEDLKNYGFKITVITARNIAYTKDTRAWVRDNKIPTRKVLHLGIEKEKAKNIDVYLDDAPEVISRLIKHEKKIVVMNHLYNKSIEDHDNIRRTDGWNETLVNAVFELLDDRNKAKGIV